MKCTSDNSEPLNTPEEATEVLAAMRENRPIEYYNSSKNEWVPWIPVRGGLISAVQAQMPNFSSIKYRPKKIPFETFVAVDNRGIVLGCLVDRDLLAERYPDCKIVRVREVE